MQTKPWYKSKLIWLGILTAIGSTANEIAIFIQQEKFDIGSIIGLIVGLVTVWQRMKTDTVIS